MKNYKLDIKEMKENYNNFNRIACQEYRISGKITQEQMSEMVQKHIGKLKNNGSKTMNETAPYIEFDSNSISTFWDKGRFLESKNKKIGLEFFSIKPEKFVTVRMPEDDYNYCKNTFAWQEQIKKWELVE